jgi:peptide/nickel transport system ATP-binding protein
MSDAKPDNAPPHDLRKQAFAPIEMPKEMPTPEPPPEKAASAEKASPKDVPEKEMPPVKEGPRKLVTICDLEVPGVNRVSLDIDAGETVVLLGEAGSGTDALVRALVRTSRKTNDAIALNDARVAYVPNPRSRPLSSFSHAASQFARVIARKRGILRMNAKNEFGHALERFSHAPRLPAFRLRPHELSAENIAWGLLASAIAQEPQLVLLENAFSGLAPSEIARLTRGLRDEQKRLGFAVVAASMTVETARALGGRIIMMRDGRIVAEGNAETLESASVYAQSFFKAATPQLPARALGRGEPVVKAIELGLAGASKKGRSALSFELRRGNVLALVGERGSGRRQLVRIVLGLEPVEKGRVVLDSVDVGILSQQMMTRLRRRVGYIGDDALLDPRMTAWDTVEEPLRAHLHLGGAIAAGYRDAALKRVGLDTIVGSRPVGSLSAFDKRRLQIARAIVSAPLLVIVDEPFTSLDTMAQGVVRDLLRNFRAQEGPAFIVVTSDVRVAQMLADEVFVMKDRIVVERGLLNEVLAKPKEAYTKGFIEASRYSEPGLSPETKQG